LVIVVATDTTVELRSSKSPADFDSLLRGGTWGLEWDGGYGQVSDVLLSSADSVTRAFMPFGPLPAAGTASRFDENAFPTDPAAALGLAFEGVVFDSDLGTFRAWFVPADPGETWMVFVHGRDADRRQGLRLLDAVRETGVTALIISYRNDRGEPANPDGLRHYGATEWPEVEGAVRFALDNGAKHIVLAGYSMGGSMILAFMERLLSRRLSSARPRCASARLDQVDFRRTNGHAPSVLTKVGKWIASWRFDVDWGDRLPGAPGRSGVPILLFHGARDDETPIAESEELADLRPDLVTFTSCRRGACEVMERRSSSLQRSAVRSFFGRLPWVVESPSARPAP
jgi:predicted esterase